MHDLFAWTGKFSAMRWHVLKHRKDRQRSLTANASPWRWSPKEPPAPSGAAACYSSAVYFGHFRLEGERQPTNLAFSPSISFCVSKSAFEDSLKVSWMTAKYIQSDFQQVFGFSRKKTRSTKFYEIRVEPSTKQILVKFQRYFKQILKIHRTFAQ